MRPNNKQLDELLKGVQFQKKSLGPQVIDQELRNFQKIVQKNNRPIASHNLFNINFLNQFNIMELSKKIAVLSLATIIVISAVTTGFDKVMAFELASQIQNSEKASDYKMDLSFGNVFLNGHVVSKDYVIKKSKDNYEKIDFFGGSTKNVSVSPDIIKEAEANAIVPSEEELANSYLADGSPALKKSTTTEDNQKNVNPVSTESYDFISDSDAFKSSVKFLELEEASATTFIGVDKDGELSFFEQINK